MNNKGTWLSSFQQGAVADRPTEYPGSGNFALYFATDTGVLYAASFVANEGAATWVAVGSAASVAAGVTYDEELETFVLPNIPTADPGVAGALYSNSGVVTVSAGA